MPAHGWRVMSVGSEMTCIDSPRKLRSTGDMFQCSQYGVKAPKHGGSERVRTRVRHEHRHLRLALAHDKLVGGRQAGSR